MSGKMTDYPRCKTCKHWDRQGPQWEGLYGCMNPKVVDGFGTVDEANAMMGDFYTGPDFGCIHHEPKESPK